MFREVIPSRTPDDPWEASAAQEAGGVVGGGKESK
jgi:hypothetical protein